MVKTTTDQDLEKIEKVAYKLRNNMRRADIDFTIQASRNTTDPGITRWALSMTAPANNLAPIVFIALTPEDLIKQIKGSIKNLDHAAVEKAYHQAQIDACERTIAGHKERIETIDKGEAEEVYYDGDLKDFDGDYSKKEKPETTEDVVN